MIKKTANQSGFSLVETLVAITILLIVIVGPMTISTSTARSTSFSSEQVVAFFLAQEGVEIIQSARDDYLLAEFNDSSPDPQAAWDEFTRETGGALLHNCHDDDGCRVELQTNGTGDLVAPGSCSTIANCKLYYDNSSGVRSRYTHTDTGNDTPFTRVIRITDVTANEYRVVSTVSWRTGNQRDAQEVSVETHLFNVYGN